MTLRFVHSVPVSGRNLPLTLGSQVEERIQNAPSDCEGELEILQIRFRELVNILGIIIDSMPENRQLDLASKLRLDLVE